MKILYLGHAGFLITHYDSAIIIDPWFSEKGAYNQAWYQFPRNHELITVVGEAIKNMKSVRIILSHEHADHFCRETLSNDQLKMIGIAIPKYRSKSFYNAVQEIRDDQIIEVADRDEIRIGTIYVSFIIDDSGLDRDAGILVRSTDGKTFLNFNDCKAFDQLYAIRDRFGSIDIFTCQFSGAIRHPVCYEYDDQYYKQVSNEKLRVKFEIVRAAIDSLDPKIFLPSAGPCAFLDPNLFHLNFDDRGQIFAKSWNFLKFMRGAVGNTQIEEFFPGDTVCLTNQTMEISKLDPVVSAETFAEYMQHYQSECWRPRPVPREKSTRLESLFLADLAAKLKAYRQWGYHINVAQNLYFETSVNEPYVKVEFCSGQITKTPDINDTNFYIHRVSWEEIAALYDDNLGWGGHALTFRVSIRRQPDVYDRVIDLFLTSTIDQFRDGLQYLDRIRLESETIEVAADGGQKFRIRRYCPHQGADLLGAQIKGFKVICPRHGWEFDLENGGVCDARDCDIAAEAI